MRKVFSIVSILAVLAVVLQFYFAGVGHFSIPEDGLFGIHGNKKAHLDNFPLYSANMKAKGGTWDDASLNEFLWKPAAYIKGTGMNFAGLSNDKERANVIAFLKSLK